MQRVLCWQLLFPVTEYSLSLSSCPIPHLSTNMFHDQKGLIIPKKTTSGAHNPEHVPAPESAPNLQQKNEDTWERARNESSLSG